MKSPAYGSVWIAVVWTCGFVCPSAAIEVQPAQAQVQLALDRGKEAAAHRQAPETLYARFGSGDDLHPGGFLVTKLGGLSVMATHMALRGLEPSAADIAQVTEAPTMLRLWLALLVTAFALMMTRALLPVMGPCALLLPAGALCALLCAVIDTPTRSR